MILIFPLGKRCADMEVVFDSNIATSSVFGVAAGDVLRAIAHTADVSCCQLLSVSAEARSKEQDTATQRSAAMRNTFLCSVFDGFFFQKDVIEVL